MSNRLIEIALSVATGKHTMSLVVDLFARIGKNIAVVQDRIGMVMPRILSMLINEAFFTVMEDVAAPQDIDTAMKLGTHYPSGPIEWANRIGVDVIVTVLDALKQDLGEERYHYAPLLRQMVLSRADGTLEY